MNAKELGMTNELRVGSDAQDGAEVSVVIPCLNEANSIGICVSKAISAFHAAGLRGEVVVADNGSTDGSIEIAENLGARVVGVQARGYGSALRAGIAAARGAFIVMGDADDSYDFSEVPRFVEKWRQGNEVVMGNRFRGEIKPGAMPWHHKYVGNPALSSLLNLFFRTGISDSHCGMRGFTVVFIARRGICVARVAASVLAAARAASTHAADYPGSSYHDFWRDFHSVRRSDTFHWRVC